MSGHYAKRSLWSGFCTRTLAQVLILCLFYLAPISQAVRPLPTKGSGGMFTRQSDPSSEWEDITPSETLVFSSCSGVFQCARLLVPLDWNNTDSGLNTTIAIIKRPALVNVTDSRYAGAVLINPGGPGGSGVDWVEFYGEALQTTLDIRSGPPSQQRFYDLVSWDPRGINNTVPVSSGISDPTVLSQFTQMLTDFGYSLDDDDVFSELWALNKLYGELVSAPENGNLGQAGHIGQYIGTAYVARDMVEIVERYGEWRAKEAKELLQDTPNNATVEAILQRTAWQKNNEKIQYWGFSYGTILGQTFASMYPERTGRFVLDGVANITDYYTGAWKGAFHSDEDINANFTAVCVQAGPSTCPMKNWVSKSSQSDQSTDLLTELGNHLEYLKSNPVTGLFDNAQTPIIVTWSDAMRNLITLYYNGWAGYRIASRVLYELSQGNATWFHLTTSPPFACPVPSSFKDYTAAAVAIECVDADDKTSETKEDWKHYINELKNITPTFYGYGATLAMPCTGYQQRAKWRYAGPFGATAQQLGNPILFVSQTLDPICPLVAAEDGFGRFEGSGLVEAQGVGHCSFGWPNACALGEIRKYFATGEVSTERILCPASVSPFETAVQAQGRLNGTHLDETERELLSVALEVGSIWPGLNTGGY